MRLKILYIIIIISLLVSSITIYDRSKIELENKSIEFIIDYNELQGLSRQSGRNISWWLTKFKELGMNSVAIHEETLESMIGEGKDLEVDILKNIKNKINWKSNFDDDFINYIEKNELDLYNTIVRTEKSEIFNFIMTGLEARFPKSFYRAIKTSGAYYIVIDSQEVDGYYDEASILTKEGKRILPSKNILYYSRINYIGLGFDIEKINAVKTAGLRVIPRPSSFSIYPVETVEAFKKELEENDLNPFVLLFTGDEVLKHEESRNIISEYMKERDIKVGLVETEVQRQHLEVEGLESIISNLDYNAVRVFTIWDWIQQTFKNNSKSEAQENIVNFLYRAITERNINIIYFKPFKYDKYRYVTDYDQYRETIEHLESRLEKHDIKIGEFSNIKNYHVSKNRLYAIALGVLAISILIINYIFNVSRRIGTLLFFVGTISIFIVSKYFPGLFDKFVALTSSIVFPCIAIIFYINYSKKRYIQSHSNERFHKILLDSIQVLLICCLISIVGGIFVGATLASTKYLLEIDIFRGVKLSLIVPILISLVIHLKEFWVKVDNTEEHDSISFLKLCNDLLNHVIRVKYILVTIIVLFIVYIYIARTGHETNVAPLELEIKIRNLLERIFIARPRNKEFLIGFPSLMLGIFMSYKKNKVGHLAFTTCAVLGLTSIVNSFSHIRTPLYMQFFRTLFSTILGMGIGAILLLALNFLYPKLCSLKKNKI